MEMKQVTHRSKKPKWIEIKSTHKKTQYFTKDYQMPFHEPDGRVGRAVAPQS